MTEKCSFPRCNNLSDFGYIGRSICAKHWGQLCASSDDSEKKLLKKIGLVRDIDGAVVLIKG